MQVTRTQEVSNSDLFLFALYELDGAEMPVDIEDVFLKMYEIVPERFSWRKHQLPNYKVLHTAMADAERDKSLLAGTLLGSGWERRLSENGIGYVERRMPLLRKLVGGEVQAPPDKRPLQRAAAAVEKHPAFRRFMAGIREPIKRHELAVLLRCTPDSPRDVWRERVESLRAAAASARRKDLLAFLSWIENDHSEVFGGAA